MKKATKVKTKPKTTTKARPEAEQEPLLNRLARHVGRTAGKIVAAGQGLGITEDSAEQPRVGDVKSQRKPKRRSKTQKKEKIRKSHRVPQK